MKKILSYFFLLTLILNTTPLAAQNYFGITPDQKYSLPNNVGVYFSETGKISTCISLYNQGVPSTLNGQRYFGVSFQLNPVDPSTITLSESRVFNESKIKTASGEEPACSGSYDVSTKIYQDIIDADSIPHYMAYSLVDETIYEFQLTDSLQITQKADIAFVLRGYNDTTEYTFPASFRSSAKKALEDLSELSFGKINSYRIFDGGIDPNSPDYYQSVEHIQTVDAALAGWVGQPWESFRERDAASGTILINPTEEEIAVLKSLKQWLVDNRKGAGQGWHETELGVLHYDAWLFDKVLRYSESASTALLKGLRLPEGVNEDNYKTIGIIFSSTDTYNTSAAMSTCNHLQIKTSDGQKLDDSYTCFYDDYSDLNPGTSTAQDRAEGNSYVTVHEVIHALGHFGHGRDESGDYFPYSIMNQGKADQYPIWNRVFLLGWLPESTITDDPDLVTDTHRATDPNAKYLLRLGPENDFDCQDQFGEAVICHRYQELYDGNWIQYRTTYTVDGSSQHKGGVTFEPLKDISGSSKKAPEVILSDAGAAEIVRNETEQIIKIKFDEKINLGKGSIAVHGDDGALIESYQTNRLPEISSDNLTISGDSLSIRIYQSGGQFDFSGFKIERDQNYSIVFSAGSIIDRAGNSVDQRSYNFIDKTVLTPTQ